MLLSIRRSVLLDPNQADVVHPGLAGVGVDIGVGSTASQTPQRKFFLAFYLSQLILVDHDSISPA